VKTGRKVRGNELRFDQTEDGGIAGLRLGYGWRGASGLYLGIEAEGALGIEAKGSSARLGVAFQGSYEGEASGFVRLGYAPVDSLLLYARAGGSYERYEMRINGGHRSASRGAPAFGLGIEAALLQDLSIRLDGTYVPPTGGSFEVQKYAVTLGVSWFFWSRQ
jgi:opacity protein-like surface antigen